MDELQEKFLTEIAFALAKTGVPACLVIYQMDEQIRNTVVSIKGAPDNQVEGLNTISDYINFQLSKE